MKKLVILALLAGSAAADAQGGGQAGDQRTIIVTATRIEDLKQQLEACLARRCPPAEDMAASIRYAEAMFVQGDYRSARQILQKSIGRNDRHAAQHPHEVASLYRADARISINLGDGQTYRQSTYGAVRSLRKGLPEKDRALLAAQFDVAAMLFGLGKKDEAQMVYGRIARSADEYGARDLGALAQLRSAWIDYRTGEQRQAKPVIERLANSTDPELKQSRLAALVLLSRIRRTAGEADNTDQLITALADAGFERQTLLWAPAIELEPGGDGPGHGPWEPSYGSHMLQTPSENFEKKWADIGFWVKPDGSVEEPEVLRSSGSQDWIKPVLSSITKRVYSPSRSSTGTYRLERYTRTSLLFTPTGSRIEQRGARGRIEYVDLTEEKPAKQTP